MDTKNALRLSLRYLSIMRFCDRRLQPFEDVGRERISVQGSMQDALDELHQDVKHVKMRHQVIWAPVVWATREIIGMHVRSGVCAPMSLLVVNVIRARATMAGSASAGSEIVLLRWRWSQLTSRVINIFIHISAGTHIW